MRTRFAFVLVALSLVCPAFADVVVPNDRANTAGTGVFLGPLSNAQRTYQLLIDDTQLTGIVGQQVDGITWRLPSAATANYPTADILYNNFDIRLSESVEPSARSLTFANNVVGAQTLVRSGALTIGAGSFKVEPVAPHGFGMLIQFDTPYAYTGGNLLIELRTTGHNGSSSSVDAMITSSAGYGTLFSAAWQSSYTATTGLQGNAVVTQIHTVVPEPASLALLAGALMALISRRRRA
ncbi:hypothetical protein BH09PLA1_BH09PLA1_13910 [soil metagenome]